MHLRIPPLLLTFIVAVLMSISARLTPLGVDTGRFGLIVGAILGLLGLALSAAGLLSFLQKDTTANPLDVHSASALVTSGLYRFSRNPMYLGMLLFLAGLAVYLGNALALLLCIGFVFYMNAFQIKPEEAAMESLFGEEFETYRKRVRRWI